jgi:uncharacterized protein
MIKRDIEHILLKRWGKGKAIIVMGPRQTGKTTLLSKIALEKGKYLLLDCDELIVRENLEKANLEDLKQLTGSYPIVFIDEAQRVKNIGLSLKIIIDQIKDIQLLVSGSSALELANEINEPLTGRKWEYLLYPLSWQEIRQHFGYLTVQKQLNQRLVFGMYPDVINNQGDEKAILKQLASSYLYKDLLSLASIRKPDLLPKLLKALAFQIGSEVSLNELSNLLGVNKDTIASYMDLLEKAFIIFRMEPFSRNIRNEIKSTRKVYFYDNGIRNAIISNYNSPEMRQDTGALWENFLISERKKYLEYNEISASSYFWRTAQKQEIDYIEEREGKIFAFEFKWNPKAKAKIPKTFSNTYKVESFLIHRDNFEQFVLNTPD